MTMFSRLADRLLKLRPTGNPATRSASTVSPKPAASPSPQESETFTLGLELFKTKRYARAIECFESVIASKHDWADVHYYLGVSLLRVARFEEASDAFNMACCFAPRMAEAYLGLAEAESEQGKVDAALGSIDKALTFEASAAAFNLKGSLLLKKDDLSGASASFQSAVTVAPGDSVSHSNLGYVLFRELGEYERGAWHIERALELDPRNEDVQCNFSMLLSHHGKYEQALDLCERLLKSSPHFHEARLNRALILLMLGRFEKAWDDYEARKIVRSNYNARLFPCPDWEGQDLRDKSILVHGEQGLGDEIMFASCFPDLISRAKSCVIECEPRLEPLFKRSFGKAKIVTGAQATSIPAWWSEQTGIDFHVPAGSLPRYFRRSEAAFPAHSGYLQGDPARIEYWSDRLRHLGPGLKVGISWRGGAQSTRQQLRTIGLSKWAALLQTQGIHFVNLQYGDTSLERERLLREHGVRLHSWDDAIADLDETAALITALDLVVSVCTAVIHLAGAVGRPVWVLVPSSPEWRYQVSGETMPWYPSATLLRQKVAGSWGPVMSQVCKKLRSCAQRG